MRYAVAELDLRSLLTALDKKLSEKVEMHEK
jgi:hypothetical protein